MNPKMGKSIEPARKFDVTLEPDNFTEEKSVDPEFHRIFFDAKEKTDTHSSKITKNQSITRQILKSLAAASSAFSAQDSNEPLRFKMVRS